MFGLDNLIDMLFDTAMESVSRNERIIKLLKHLKLDPEHPPEDFPGVYRYTLVEYGVGKPRPVLEIFRQDKIQTLFREALERNSPSLLLKNGEAFLDDHPLQADLQANNVDVCREFYEFAAVFIEVAKRTRTPAEILAEQKLDSLHRQIGTLQERLSRLPTLEGMRTEMARLAAQDNPALPAGEAFSAEQCKAFALAQQMRGWFETLGFRFESHEVWQDDYFEWIINIPIRRGRYDRILVRGIDGEAGLRDVEDLKQAVETHRTDEGWLVTARRISRAARDEVNKEENDGLGCYTLDELLDQDADFSGYLNWLESEIQKRGIAQKYVPLACLKEEVDPDTKQRIGVSRYDDRDGWIDGYIDLWLDDPVKEHISVLGEFGTGKTWFALHYAWKALQHYREAQKRGLDRPRLPLVIPLRDYAKAVSVESLFSEFFFRKHEIPIPGYSAFEQLNRMGKLLLIFDGFDEMAARVDRQEMINNFWELAKVVVPGAKVILTCRTEHFPDAQEGRALMNAELQASTRDLTGETPQFEVLELEKFNDQQIRQVLEYQAKTATVDQIINNPQLLDLARRPVLTELILEALPDIEAGKPVDMSRIYLYAVRHKMERDIKAERTFTSMADKLYFMCELSWEMLSTDRMSINYREFPDRIRKLFGAAVEKEKDLDHWHYDMMGQTMLIRNADGDYTPAHRSLLEFFVAYKFAAELGVLEEDFVDLIRCSQESPITQSIDRKYRWSDYFSFTSVLQQEARASEISEFCPEPIEKISKTFGTLPISKAVMDLIQPLIIKGKVGESRLLQVIFDSKQGSEHEIRYLCGNVLKLLTDQNPIALEGVDLSNCVIIGGDFSNASLRKTRFINSIIKNSSFIEPLGTILAACFSPDNKFVAAAEASGRIFIWNTATGTVTATLEGHTNWVRTLAFTPDGRHIVSAGDDREIRIWKVSTWNCLQIIKGHIGRIRCLCISPSGDRIVSVSNDGSIKIWDFNGNCEHSLDGHAAWIFSVDYDSTGHKIATGGDDSKLKIWDVRTGECLQVHDYHHGRVNALAFSTDGRFLASGGNDRKIYLLNIETGMLTHVLEGHTDFIRSVCFSRDSKYCISAGFDSVIKIWDIRQGRCIKNLAGHSSWIRSIRVSSDGKHLVSGGDDQTVKFWDINSGNCIRTFQGYAHLFLCVDIHPNKTIFVSGSKDSLLRFWDIKTGQCQKVINNHANWSGPVKFSPDGKVLATSSGDNRDLSIKLWNVETGELIQKIINDAGRIRDFVFDRQGKLIISGGVDAVLRLWDIESGQCLHSFTGHQDNISSIAICSTQNLIVTGSEDKTIGLWDLDVLGSFRRLEGHSSGVWGIAFSPDEQVLASGSRDHTIRLWDLTSMECSRILEGHTDRVKAVVFNSDGNLLISGSHDRTIRIWDVHSGQCLHILKGHDNWISSLNLIPNSSVVISSSEDGTIRMWDINQAECLKIITPDRPYEGMDITGVKGLSPGKKSALKTLGAIEKAV
ncbi:WD40 repeat-containing protein [Leptolyngbya sp. PCC 7375]|nr:WD40 repeat-containing protein [Leptolyngbya sp. PCC 7375]